MPHGGQVSHQRAGSSGIVAPDAGINGAIAAIKRNQRDLRRPNPGQDIFTEAAQHIGNRLQDDPRRMFPQQAGQMLPLLFPAAVGFHNTDRAARILRCLADIPQECRIEIFLPIRDQHGDLTAAFPWCVGSIGAAALAAHDESLFLQDGQRTANRLAAAAVFLAEGSLCGQTAQRIPILPQPTLQLPCNN